MFYGTSSQITNQDSQETPIPITNLIWLLMAQSYFGILPSSPLLQEAVLQRIYFLSSLQTQPIFL